MIAEKNIKAANPRRGFVKNLATPLGFLILFSVLGCPALIARAEESGELLITENSVGKLHLGMNIEDAKGITGLSQFKMLDLEREGLFSPAIILSNVDGQSVIGEIACSHTHQWTLWRIQIYDRRYRNAQGVGVGTSYSQLSQREPHARLFDEEGSRLVIDSVRGITYVLDEKPLESATVRSVIVNKVGAR